MKLVGLKYVKTILGLAEMERLTLISRGYKVVISSYKPRYHIAFDYFKLCSKIK